MEYCTHSKKGNKEDSGSYQPVSLTSMPDKIMEQIYLDRYRYQKKDRKVIRDSQHGFTKGKLCLTSGLLQWSDNITGQGKSYRCHLPGLL